MEKELEYRGKVIKYKVIKKKIKNMYLKFYKGNVLVSAPNTISDKKIEEFVISKWSWLIRNFERYQAHNREENNKDEKEYNTIKLLGLEYKLDIKYENNENNGVYRINKENQIVTVYLPIGYKELNKDKLKLVLDKYKQYIYKKELKDIVDNALKKYQRLTGLKVNKCTIKFMKSAWGRCNSNRNISINTELVKYSKRAIESVVLHEVCHIKYMNHSKMYWNYVKIFMPDYDEVKEELK